MIKLAKLMTWVFCSWILVDCLNVGSTALSLQSLTEDVHFNKYIKIISLVVCLSESVFVCAILLDNGRKPTDRRRVGRTQFVYDQMCRRW